MCVAIDVEFCLQTSQQGAFVEKLLKIGKREGSLSGKYSWSMQKKGRI
jgi:hypothetical protein